MRLLALPEINRRLSSFLPRANVTDAPHHGGAGGGFGVEQNHLPQRARCRGLQLSGVSLRRRSRPLSGARFNTVSAIWWGHNCDVAGGSGHVVEDNIFADNGRMGVFALNLPGSYPMHPLTGAIIRRNTFLRGGGNFAWQKRGAIWIYPGSTSISDVLFQDNEVLDPVFRAIHFAGPRPQSITFKRNRIERPGETAIHFDGEATGTATFENNIVSGLPKDGKVVVNDSKAPLAVVQTGNSWQ